MDNVTLIGMSGSGKSILGSAVAEKLGYGFLDTDAIIESYGRSLSQILKDEGDAGLLKIEEKAILDISCRKTVIVPGGSCIYSEKGMDYIKQISTVVFINVFYNVIEKRMDATRMSNIVGLSERNLDELYESRMPLYQKYADLTISLNRNSVEQNAFTLFSEICLFRYKFRR
jgi:shikimate kinase